MRKRNHRKTDAQYKLVALGAVCFLPTYREVIKAASYLGPDVLCTVTRPDGKLCFSNAAAREVTGLGRGILGNMLRQKRQANASR